ncbi:hypothetical protein EV361DRAFT_855650 [Lentinula raphanica]|nr:hypothetical protein EV361DRAFT_855650 [Lentinula raphanica]
MWRRHLHQHPAIPLNDTAGTHLAATDIHKLATQEIYKYCERNDLAQVWAYLWNRWYTPKQWVLWARAACDSIPRTKTTMMVESTWKHIKRRDLHQFNRPRLDLLVHVVLTNLLPRVQQKIQYILGKRRAGRPHPLAKWQESIKRDWHNMSQPDEYRSMVKELACLKDRTLKEKAKAELLADIEADRQRPRGGYHTNVETMTCSCPSYLISRWLLCKHLVREVNAKTSNLPLNNLSFFRDLRRNHTAPFYKIPGLHSPQRTDSMPDTSRANSPSFHSSDSSDDLNVGTSAVESEQPRERSSPFCSDDEGEASKHVSETLSSLS